MADAVDKMMTELRSACAKEQIVRSHHVIYAQEAIAALRAELEQVKRENQKLRGDCKAYEKTMEAIAAAEAAERLAGARVKALEWTRNLHGITQWAETPFGSYAIDPTRSRPMRFMWSGITGDWMAADTEAQAKAAAQADYERRILSALAEPAGEAEPDFAASIAEVIKEESLNEAACGWRPCTGCHETNEGYETGRYPYSAMFDCHVGHGCSECGGLGVVWEYWSKDALDDMARDVTTSPDASAIREALLAEIDRLRPEYQSNSMLDHGRRQMLDHFAALAGAKP